MKVGHKDIHESGDGKNWVHTSIYWLHWPDRYSTSAYAILTVLSCIVVGMSKLA